MGNCNEDRSEEPTASTGGLKKEDLQVLRRNQCPPTALGAKAPLRRQRMSITTCLISRLNSEADRDEETGRSMKTETPLPQVSMKYN